MPSRSIFADLPPEYSDPDTAAVVIVPVPFDGTSTWKRGADRGPAALIEASAALELYDVQTGTEVYRHGIATLEPIECTGGVEGWVEKVDAQVRDLLRRERVPVVIGGDHSVSIGAIRAAANAKPNVSVLQIDAHADTRSTYQGSPFNHACVMARARQWCPVVQVGIRALDGAEVPQLEAGRVFFAHDIVGRHRTDRQWIDDAVEKLTDNVYVTIDLDAFDPALVPATGTPEPGGLGWYEVDALLERLTQRRCVVGFDVVELLPTPGHWASDFLAAKLAYRFLSLIFAHRRQSM